MNTKTYGPYERFVATNFDLIIQANVVYEKVSDGTIGCYSGYSGGGVTDYRFFYINKDDEVLITDDEQLAKRARKLTTTARKIHPWLYEHDELGFNYRLPNLNAALGVAQMEQLPYYIKSKRKLAKEYQKWCEEKGVEIFMEPPDTCSNYWLNALDLKDLDMRDKFLEYTNSRHVMTRPMWTLMTDLPMYQNCLRTDLSNSRAAGCSLVNIPSSVV